MKTVAALALLASILAGCGGGSGGGGPVSRAALSPPASEGVGFGFDASGNPVYGQQTSAGIRTYGLGGVRTEIPATGLPETFNVVYGNVVVAYWQGTGTFYVVRPDGAKRTFTAARFVGSDGAWRVLVEQFGEYAVYDAQADATTVAPVPTGDRAWGYSGAFIGVQEGDGGPGKRAYVLSAGGGSPTFLSVPANTTQTLPQVLLSDGRSVGTVKLADGTYQMVAWSAAGAFTLLGTATTDIATPVGYANDGTYAYVLRTSAGNQSFVVLPGAAPVPASTFGPPARYVVQGLSSNGRYFFAGPANGDTPTAYRIP